jgi:hypothetical protein
MPSDLKTWYLVVGFVSATALLRVTSNPARQLSLSQKTQAQSVADGIASLIQGTRTKGNLRPLRRLKASHQLLQEVCTAAALDHAPKTGNFSDGQFFRVENRELSSTDQVKIENEALWKTNRRFEVAAWPVKPATPSTNQHYWVGVRVLAGSFLEFLVGHFSDDIYYSGEWKKNVARECRAAR